MAPGSTIGCRAACSVTLLAAVSVVAWGAVGRAQQHTQVLAIYSSARATEAAVVAERELPRTLERSLPGGLDYFSEFIDQSRSPGPNYPAAFRDFLRLKYEGRRLDLVIAMDHGALEFVENTRAELFPDAPVVFFSSRPAPPRVANSTGVNAPINLAGTLALVTQLQPDVEEVFVVTGSDRSYENLARAQFAAFEQRFSFTYLSALPTAELERRLSALPPQSIVYYVHVARDGANETFDPLQYLERVAAVANAPTYCWVDSAMDHGIVGGSVRSLTAQVDAVSDLALRVLRGERADDIPVSVRDLNSMQVDWRQLQRWNISEARVPAGTTVLFRTPSGWERYGIFVAATLALVLAQSALIAGLLVQRARRRQSEARERTSQNALQGSYRRIRDLAARLLGAQDGERARIARELHDDISQQLAVLEIDLEVLGSMMEPHAKGLASDALARAQTIAHSVHGLSHRLHPAKLQLIGLVSALDGLRRELAQTGAGVTFSHRDVPPKLPHEVTLCLFRIAQEALQNAVKHSGARTISVHLQGNPREITLTISDDGKGFDVDAVWGKGLGVISMNERVEAAGGTFEIRSAPGTGSRVSVRVPLGLAGERQSLAV